MWALYLFERGGSLPDSRDIQNAINNNDVEKARILIEEYQLIHPKNTEPK
jgi:hypothetical protein